MIQSMNQMKKSTYQNYKNTMMKKKVLTITDFNNYDGEKNIVRAFQIKY